MISTKFFQSPVDPSCAQRLSLPNALVWLGSQMINAYSDEHKQASNITSAPQNFIPTS
jgi:hypothetical protein